MNRTGAAGLSLSIIRDLYIEVFGVVVPGLCFVVFFYFGLILPVSDFIAQQDGAGLSDGIIQFLIANPFPAFIILSFIAYVAGQIFYRTDPKIPDQAGIRFHAREHYRAKRIIEREKKSKELKDEAAARRKETERKRDEEKKKLKEEREALQKAAGKKITSRNTDRKWNPLPLLASWMTNRINMTWGPPEDRERDRQDRLKARLNAFPSGCVRHLGEGRDEYPYGYLWDYLWERNFQDLTDYVTWEGEKFGNDNRRGDGIILKASNHTHRSKHLINQFKLRVRLKNVALHFELVRNEAHIRLMSSLWYVARASIFASVVGFAAALLYPLMRFLGGMPVDAALQGSWEIISFPLFVCFLSALIFRSISRIIHYQRVREIIFVLKAYRLVMEEGDDGEEDGEQDDETLYVPSLPGRSSQRDLVIRGPRDRLKRKKKTRVVTP